ncbi:MAG: 3-phosphoshikimate 1-carboxyvinyltransferase [Proteobacteria bacterium]|nr:3-phosphoshikimate 1-carboxyvinyltransferase [Pseudomonadota bacterium]MBU1139866.1 3-phosphoshikimate 1-carboxyvinyltransferase [Pseudomonadota bacterium]MBU1233395.1 3-phosphoshikimate 1-carboxyvinyltransferase [Pseudomonadota bacterium]MBU1417270.1 3-phosphoshikimate 1-carboxyvinyltransferase [Pseudomonadota bacterium]MBU1453987.1 3-phosphoshikimate 1-carboxyvinyltransferase [Pseudomonadota bacterium]
MKEIIPVSSINATVRVPGSKSLTQRALIAAALADGSSKLIGPLASEDTSYTSQALEQMGIDVERGEDVWSVHGKGGQIVSPDREIFLGNNGTATRFLTSVAALGHGPFRIDGEERMRERPIGPLMAALKGWGVDISSVEGTGCPPLLLASKGLSGGATVLPEGKSSQYLSSLLLVAPYAVAPATLTVVGEVLSKPYVAMTLSVMSDFGIDVDCNSEFTSFTIPQGKYRAMEYQIEGDASNASYFWAAAAITGGRVTVSNVPVPSLQGDAGLVPLLARMGCEVSRDGNGITLQGRDRLEGITVDMGDMPDVVPTLAVVAAFAHGKTVINNIAHLRIKECDRLSAVLTELGKMGAKVEEGKDFMVIHGSGGEGMHGAEIETYKDHRMAMSFAVAGLRVPGVLIRDEDCVAKSFPDFWKRFEWLR